MVRPLDIVHLLINLKLPSLLNNHLQFLPLVNNKPNLSLVSSHNQSQLRLSRLGKECKGVKPADNSDGTVHIVHMHKLLAGLIAAKMKDHP